MNPSADKDREEAPRIGSGYRDWEWAAHRLGEMMCADGPKGYYLFTPQQLVDWASSLPSRTVPETGRASPDQLIKIDDGQSTHARTAKEWLDLARADLASRSTTRTLWLWKNFVDGKPEYWAFDNPYPTHGGGDPMTLGEPCGYAILKDSTRSHGHPASEDAQVMAALLKRADRRKTVGWCKEHKAPMSCCHHDRRKTRSATQPNDDSAPLSTTTHA